MLVAPLMPDEPKHYFAALPMDERATFFSRVGTQRWYRTKLRKHAAAARMAKE
jgi:hypothetical protein